MTTGDGLMMAVLLMATKFAVPVFIFITGMVLFYNDKGQPTRKVHQEAFWRHLRSVCCMDLDYFINQS